MADPRASLIDSILFGVKVSANIMGFNTIYELMFGTPAASG